MKKILADNYGQISTYNSRRIPADASAKMLQLITTDIFQMITQNIPTDNSKNRTDSPIIITS